ncbi:hypothetical protein LX32DRAFT_669148 [Colletotrichum zoysiae]|uniref:F-box domain-containing protein n=1 Tax=Colletotrichum zoysiae TaxID=1216348 RepID=A0AAD9H1B0_9PEZI|nr:hypothetical protein LX32DRAFT_669148 [Colletotrichum zoysiae]
MAACSPDFSLDMLPREILILILAELPDVRALYQLIRASPAACRLYTAVGAEVLERVLARSVPPQIHELIRLAVAVSTSTPTSPIAPSFAAFLDRHIRPAADDHDYFPSSPPLGQVCGGEKELRRVLLVARRIACLTPICIAGYRERCLSITPSHRTECGGGSSQGAASKPWKERFEGTPYRPQDVGPPTWIEEQRVVRGLWRLQVFHELKTALSEDRTGWPEEDRQRAADVTPEDLFDGWRQQLEELLTVVDFVRERMTKPGEGFAIRDRDMRLPNPPAGDDDDAAPSWPVLRQPPLVDAWPGWARRLNAPAAAWAFFSHLHTNPRSPIRGVEFWPFRRLGLAIWGREKLAKLELTNPAGLAASKGPLRSRKDVEFTWRSLLPGEYLVRLEQGLEEDWQNAGRRTLSNHDAERS